MPGKPAELDQRADVLAFGLHSQRVLVSAGHDVDRAGHQSIERFPAAFKVGDRNVEAVVLEVTTTFGESEWQIIEG